MPRHVPRHWFHWLFYVCLYAVYVAVLFGVADISNIASISRSLWRVLLPAFELGAIALAALWVLRRWLASRRIGWWVLYVVIALATCLVYVAQSYSIWLSNNFISVLAIQNAASSKLATGGTAIGAIGAGLVWIAILAYYAWDGTFFHGRIAAGALTRRLSRRASVALLVLCVALYAGLLTQQRKGFALEPGFRQTPIASLVTNAWLSHADGVTPTAMSVSLAADTRSCFADPEAGRVTGYPFQKDTVYRNPLPFPRVAGAPAHPNVIVIFTEGLSARNLGAYGGPYPGLTPNIDKLAQHSMKVVDYYNHTAATFRGLIGQTSSGYTFAGGAGKDGWVTGNAENLASIQRQTIADILDTHGYDTYFFEPAHAHDGTSFGTMVKSLGFRHVVNFDGISKLLDGHVAIQAGTARVDDNTLYRGLVAYLKQREASHPAQPFLIGLYNIGTHAFIPMAKDGTPYTQHPNRYLDKVHTYDHALGYFINYFLNSPYAKNTILVFTTDHATYPDKVYRDIAGKSLAPYFVDRIPLLIRDPTHVLPRTFDAEARNSLVLAPTLLQLLGIQRAPNSFLGASLFEPRHFPLGLSALGNNFYVTRTNAVTPLWGSSKKLRNIALCEQKVVEKYYQLEATNRLFKPADGSQVQPEATRLTAFEPAPTAHPPLGHPLCSLDTLDGHILGHNNQTVTVTGGQAAVFAGWFVNAQHAAVPALHFALTRDNGNERSYPVADTGISRPDVARYLEQAEALRSGFQVQLPLPRTAGVYHVAAYAGSGGKASKCAFDVTFKVVDNPTKTADNQ